MNGEREKGGFLYISEEEEVYMTRTMSENEENILTDLSLNACDG